MSCEACSPLLRNECKLLGICANSNTDADEIIDFELEGVRGIKPIDVESSIVPVERRHGTGKAPIQWINARDRESENEDTE